MEVQQAEPQAVKYKAGQGVDIQVPAGFVADDIPHMLIEVIAEVSQVGGAVDALLAALLPAIDPEKDAGALQLLQGYGGLSGLGNQVVHAEDLSLIHI